MERRKTLSTPFFPKVSPGYKIIESPINLVYLPITLDIIVRLEVSITDQDNHLLNLRNEKLTIRFHISSRYMRVLGFSNRGFPSALHASAS